MNRRDALKNASIILGFTVSAGTAAAVLNGCNIDKSADWKGEFLTNDQIRLVDLISDLIIPATDTPGASDAQVVRFVDAILACDKEEDRLKFIEGLGQFDKMSNEKFQKNFIKCKASEQTDILDQMVIRSKDKNYSGYDIFRKLKERVVVGYCKSEEGAKQFLKFDPVPGGTYEGCVDYASIGGTWAL